MSNPPDTLVERIKLATSTPTYLTDTQDDDAWLSTNERDDETGYWGYDAYDTAANGKPYPPLRSWGVRCYLEGPRAR